MLSGTRRTVIVILVICMYMYMKVYMYTSTLILLTNLILGSVVYVYFCGIYLHIYICFDILNFFFVFFSMCKNWLRS